MHLELWQPLKQVLLPWLRSQTVQIWILAEISAMLWLPISKDDLDDEQRLWKLSTATVPAHAGHHTSVQFLHQLCSSSFLLRLFHLQALAWNSTQDFFLASLPDTACSWLSEFVASVHACTRIHTHLCLLPCITIFCGACHHPVCSLLACCSPPFSTSKKEEALLHSASLSTTTTVASHSRCSANTYWVSNLSPGQQQKNVLIFPVHSEALKLP